MALKADLEAEVATFFRDGWTDHKARTVPDTDKLTFGNVAARLDAAVLYADLADSTILVDQYPDWFAAEVYKAYLHCAAKIIRSEDGEVTAYDGDRVMAIYIGDSKCTNAVRTAQKINWAVINIIQPKLNAQYAGRYSYDLKHVIGVDTSQLLVAKTGIRNANDLVWVGRAANYAAKLAALDDSHQIWITHSVYDLMNKSVKFIGGSGAHLWEARRWTKMNDMSIYRSTSWYRID